MPKASRTRRSTTRSASSSQHIHANGVVWLNARTPPGRRTRATTGTTSSGSANDSAPWSQKTTSKPSSAQGIDSAAAWTSGKSTPAATIRLRACSSCRSELSRPTIRAPCRARRIAHWAAPQPSSRTSFPATSPSTCSCASGICHIPQRGSGRLMKSLCRSWYSSDWRSQNARFVSDEVGIREPERDLARRRVGRIRAVHEVVGHRQREVAADRARRGILRIGRPHRRPDDGDRVLALDDERQGRGRRDELDQLAEEGLLAMLAVVLLAERSVDADELGRTQYEAPALESPD